jgi:hypothetical protein
MMMVWIIMIIIAAIAREWALVVGCLIAMAFFIKGQAQ